MAIKLEDPFRGSSLFSLLPKTLAASSRAQIVDYEPGDLESFKSFFKSMVVKGSTQIAQQAQTITKNYTDIHNLHPEDGSFAANCNDCQPERRPALGRKRARFSLNPVPSHSLPNIDISSSIDHIDDPEEYFSAFEQLENAEKEIKKLRGEVDPLQHYQGTTARKRRPGLLGKTASYKHHTSANVETAETVVDSQERHLDSIDAGPCDLFHSKPVDEPAASQAKNTKSKLKESSENEGSVVEKEERVGTLLKECLYSFKYLDGDEGETFLRKSLQIKPKDAAVCRLSLPSIQLSQHSAFNNRAIHGKFNNSQILSPSTKSPLQAVSTLQRRSLKDPLKDLYPFCPGDDSPCSGGSSLSKSPGKKSLTPAIVGNHDDGGFLFDDASSPAEDNETRLGFEDGICSPVVEADKSIHHRCISEERFSKLPNPVLERKTNSNPIAVGNEKGSISDEFVGSLQEDNDVLLDPVITDESDAELKGCNSQPRIQEILEYPSQLLGEDANCNSHAGNRSKDILGGLQVEGDNSQLDQPDAGVAEYSITNQPDAGVAEYSITNQPDAGVAEYSITNQPDAGVEDLTPTCANQTTTGSLENPLSKMGGNHSISVTDIEMGFSVIDDMSQSEVNVTVKEKVSDAKTSKDNSCPPEVTVLSDRHLENLHSLPDEYNEEHHIASGLPPNEGNIQKAPPTRRRYKSKSLKGRTSLAGGGMIWEDGRRKSSRRKFRPLEHWRGERLLYGRIHSSLATVIGVKYASPGKNNLKVESYVSEEYAELVAQAARC